MNSNEPKRILLVEDHMGLRVSLAFALEKKGYAVRTGSTGEEGIAIAREFQPAVVVCDMHMPHGDGQSVLTALRSEEGLGSSQFILMTADREDVSQRVGMNLGSDDYLAKPFTVDQFLQCVDARIRRSEVYQKAEARSLTLLRETIARSLPHEVNTPLTGILGFTEILREEIDRVSPAEAGRMLNEIQRSAQRLQHTLQNYLRILDVMSERDFALPTVQPLSAEDLHTLILAAATGVARRHERAADLIVDWPSLDLPLGPEGLAALVTELLDNACKYSSKGTPVELRLEEADQVRMISVIDHGRGMTPAQIGQIGAFRQFDRSRYEQQGLGLGLILTRRLVEQSGGAFQVKSLIGTGTHVIAIWPTPPHRSQAA